MDHDAYDDAFVADWLQRVRTIAVVGASPNPARPSHGVAHYLARHGYEVFLVNPGQAGREVDGLRFYATLADLPKPIDMVDVFRAPEHLAALVEEVIALAPRPRLIWTQLGVRDDRAAATAEAAGVAVIMDRCPAIEIPRLRLASVG
ncbi:CoA-binding protein [Ancylobacter amanitiformis]|uniref:CoA-binding protein n=1 Tax=Ancylobacter amanitiformis TaxID=217069 RepID=A0ABU0LL07_9HYPH|nr:CoA-binding protein [Ancylobacter amanitiformis]MDQ0509390.1 putative CoA-binding protein [Ancylobacter amanitiformis]